MATASISGTPMGAIAIAVMPAPNPTAPCTKPATRNAAEMSTIQAESAVAAGGDGGDGHDDSVGTTGISIEPTVQLEALAAIVSILHCQQSGFR